MTAPSGPPSEPVETTWHTLAATSRCRWAGVRACADGTSYLNCPERIAYTYGESALSQNAPGGQS